MKDFKFKIGSQNYTATVSEQEEGHLEVVLNGKTYHVDVPANTVAAPRPVVNPAAGAASAAAPVRRQASAPVTGAISAPLPGTITKVLVVEGAQVKKGDVILVMEAMKMANDIVAESDGTVGKIRVAEGQSVNQGDVLVEFKGVVQEAPAPAAPSAAAPAAAPVASAPAVAAGGGSVTAPLPGTVKKIMVKVGDKVNAGDTVLTMEAMKMENNITAEFAGTVKSILVSEGAQVQSGQALIEL